MNYRIVPFLSLFTSFSTLICCALPALLVTLGAGAVLAQALSALPGLIWVSEHKTIVFVLAGIMLLCGGVALWWARRLPCPLDVAQARACDRARRWSHVTYGCSVLMYLTGLGFAFLL